MKNENKRTGERQGVSPPCNARTARRADAQPLANRIDDLNV
jgi:hypothetical protein